MKTARALMVAAVALGAPLAGCSTADRTVATSSIPSDYRLRHPVVLANARQSLEVFLGSGRVLDDRQGRDVKAFAADYRARGQGRILADVPHGAVDPQAADATLAAIRRSLTASGVKGDMEVSSYQVADPGLAAPVRLSFVKMQARLASRCGEWPDDLGSGQTLQTWDNRAYYNFGCATQQTLTAQIDDPRDLVRPRAEDASDVQMRTRAIGSIRSGADPGTIWSGSALTPIGAVGGN